MRVKLGIIAIAALLLAGCGAPAPEAPGEELAGEWVLRTGSDAGGQFDLKDSTATLTLTGANTGGRTPCNIFGADISGGLGDIIVKPTFQSEAACADPTLMDVEKRYLDALAAVTAAAIDSDVLSLTGPDVALTFEIAPPVPTAKLVGTDWRLESAIDGETAASVTGDGYLQFVGDGSFTGNAGCNNFTGTWEVNDGEVSVESFEISDGECSSSAQEEHVASVFADGFTADIVGDQLTLTSLTSDLGLVYRNDASEQA